MPTEEFATWKIRNAFASDTNNNMEIVASAKMRAGIRTDWDIMGRTFSANCKDGRILVRSFKHRERFGVKG